MQWEVRLTRKNPIVDSVGFQTRSRAMTGTPLPPWVTQAMAWLLSAMKSSWQFLAGAAAFFLLVRVFRHRSYGCYSVTLVFPFNLGTVAYDTTPQDRIVAWKLFTCNWPHAKARCHSIKSYDVISDVYESLFALFGSCARPVLELPPHELRERRASRACSCES